MAVISEDGYFEEEIHSRIASAVRKNIFVEKKNCSAANCIWS